MSAPWPSLALLTDDELAAMTRRAYAGAARAWHTLNQPIPGSPIGDDHRATRAWQYAEAADLDDWHETLRAERARRDSATQQTRSARP